MSARHVWFSLLCVGALARAGEPVEGNKPSQSDRIVKRNIFRQSFYAPEPKRSAGPSAPVARLASQVLTGIMKLDDRYVAVVEDKAAGTSQLARVGSEIKGAKVVTIETASIVLERDGKQQTIELGESIGTVYVPGAAPAAPSSTLSSSPRPASPSAASPSVPSDRLRAIMEAMKKRRQGQLK